MRYIAALLLLCACMSAAGCALGQVGTQVLDSGLGIAMTSGATNEECAVTGDAVSETQGLRAVPVVLANSQATSDGDTAVVVEETDEAPPAPDPDEAPQAPDTEEVFVDDNQQPEVVLPGPAGAAEFKPGESEGDIDRFTRRLTEVPLDIRPTEGAMPDDASAAAFPDPPIPSEPGPAPDRVEVPVAYSPWTISYRPLYFEEIALERYGDSYGILQPAISGAHFFGSVAVLPYQMTVRPPRSCECSNGFSRCGDCPLPGYGEHVLRADAALIQAGIVAGIVVALP